jgi:hypothetical protein
VLVQADHHFSKQKHKRSVDDKRQLEAVFAKIFDEALEEFQDDKKSQQIRDDEAERVLQFARCHDGPDFQEHLHESHGEHEHDEEYEQFEQQVDHFVEQNEGVEAMPSVF